MSKKKLFLYITSFFLIFISGISIFMLDFIRKNTFDIINLFPDVLKEKLISVYSNDIIFIVPNIISIIIGFIILFLVFKKSIMHCKNSILVLSIIEFLIAPNIIVNILCIVNIIVCATAPSKLKKKEKCSIPKLDRIDKSSKYIVTGVLCFICFFSQTFIPSSDSYIIRLVTSILFYLFMLFICLFSFRNNIKRDLFEFKKNSKAYLFFLCSRLIIMYISFFIISFVCFFVLNHGISVNQQQLDKLPLSYLIPLACLYAPIVEELLFRGCIRRFINSDIIYIIVSGLVFGLLHTLSETSITSMIILSIPYAFIGSFYAYIYTKTNNIISTVLCHCFHNSISIVLQILFLR